jgi:hypothetical protein
MKFAKQLPVLEVIMAGILILIAVTAFVECGTQTPPVIPERHAVIPDAQTACATPIEVEEACERAAIRVLDRTRGCFVLPDEWEDFGEDDDPVSYPNADDEPPQRPASELRAMGSPTVATSTLAD